MCGRLSAALTALLLLASAGAAAAAEGEPSKGELTLFTDAGRFDNRAWETQFVQPGVELANFQPGPDIVLRGRGLFTRDHDFTEDGLRSTGKADGWDARAMLGWGFELGRYSTLNVLAGAGYYRIWEKQEFDAIDADARLATRLVAAEGGARLALRLLDRVDWVSTVTGGPVVWGEADANVGAAGGFVDAYGDSELDVDRGWVLEARTGLDLRLTDALAVRAGVSYEHLKYRLEDSTDDRRLDKKAVQIGLVFRF